MASRATLSRLSADSQGAPTKFWSVPALRRLCVATATNALGHHGAWLALMLYAYQRGGVTEVGFVGAALLLPAALAALVAGLVDHASATRRLPLAFACPALGVTLVGVAIVVDLPAGVVYLAAAALSMALSLPAPVTAGSIGVLMRSVRELTAANVGLRVALSVGRLAGPLATGLLLSLTSIGSTMLVLAGLMLCGMFVTLGIDGAEADPGLDESRSVRSELRAALFLLRSQSAATAVIASLALITVVNAALDAAVASMVIDRLQLDESRIGLLVGAFGLGSLIGAWLSRRLVREGAFAITLAAALAVCGGAFAASSAFSSLLPIGACFVAAGAAGSVASVAGRTTLQSLSPVDTLSRFFGLLEALVLTGSACGALAIAILAWAVGLQMAVVIVGCTVALIGLVPWQVLRPIDHRTSASDPALSRLFLQSPVLSPLPPFVHQQLRSHLHPARYEPHDAVLTKGAGSDAIFLISRGDVVVQLDDAPNISRGSGDHVGEVGVFQSAPRNATVLAGSDGTDGFWLDGRIFLEAVGTSPRGIRRLYNQAEERTGDR